MPPQAVRKERKGAIISGFWINPSKAQRTRESSFMLFYIEKSFSYVLACWDLSAPLPPDPVPSIQRLPDPAAWRGAWLWMDGLM